MWGECFLKQSRDPKGVVFLRVLNIKSLIEIWIIVCLRLCTFVMWRVQEVCDMGVPPQLKVGLMYCIFLSSPWFRSIDSITSIALIVICIWHYYHRNRFLFEIDSFICYCCMCCLIWYLLIFDHMIRWIFITVNT